jgi:hypothetical protein
MPGSDHRAMHKAQADAKTTYTRIYRERLLRPDESSHFAFWWDWAAGIFDAPRSSRPATTFFCGSDRKRQRFPLFFIVENHYLRDTIVADER